MFSHFGFSVVAVLLSVCVYAQSAYAGNDDEVLIGNQAVLTAGAVTATVSDSSALWFNPAGLAQLKRGRIDVSANAFVLRLYSLPGYIRSNMGNNASNADTLELVPIPSAVATGQRVGRDWVIGAGIFVSRASDRLLLSTFRNTDAQGVTTQWLANNTVTFTDTYFSLGLAHQTLPTFSWGIGVFGIYQSSFISTEFTGGTPDAQNKYFISQAVIRSEKTFGLEAGLGAQWQPEPRLRIGLSLRTPAIQLGRSLKQSDISSGAVPNGNTVTTLYEPMVRDEFNIRTQWSTPMRIRLGIAYTFEKGFVGLDGDLQTGTTFASDDGQIQKTVLTWNLRAGGRYEISPNFQIGGGVFTDCDRVKMEPPAGPKHFYGFACGIEWNSAHALAQGSRAQDIVFATTLGFRYAYGHGNDYALSLPTNLADVAGYTVVPTSLTVHEFAINLGSGFYF